MRVFEEPFSPSELTLRFNGEDYLLASQTQLSEAGRTEKRSWSEDYTLDQKVETRRLEIPLGTFHEGAGFSYANLPSTYELAHQWSAETPGRSSTWQRHAVGTAFSSVTNHRGFIRWHGGYLYVTRGQHVIKYALDTTAGNVWAAVDSHDFAVGSWCPGRPTRWSGKLYFPVRSSSALTAFAQLATVAVAPSADTWAAGPAGAEANGFLRWKDRLGRFWGHQVAFVAGGANPLVLANWSDDGGVGGTDFAQVGDPGEDINDALVWDQYIIALKGTGPWSVDENLYPRNEIPDLDSVSDSDNGVESCTWGDSVIVPHSTGIIRFKPQAWRFMGLEQEGALEGDITSGWGRAMCAINYGPTAFVSYKHPTDGSASIVSFQQPRGGRAPVVPHMHYLTTDSGWFESMTIAQDSSTGNVYLCALHVASDGLTFQPYIWRLPSANLSAANDPRVGKAVTTLSYLRTPRYWQPNRAVIKSYRCLDFWVELTATSNGLQVWASVDGGSFYQLQTAAGAAATVTTAGKQRLFFPKDSTAIGSYVQLEFRVPAGVSVTISAIRDAQLIGTYHPLRGRAMKAIVYLGGGVNEARRDMQTTFPQQKANLVAAAGRPTTVYALHTPEREDTYANVAELHVEEYRMKEDFPPIQLATVTFEEEAYS